MLHDEFRVVLVLVDLTLTSGVISYFDMVLLVMVFVMPLLDWVDIFLIQL